MGIGRTFAGRIGGGGVIFSAPRICKLFAHPKSAIRITKDRARYICVDSLGFTILILIFSFFLLFIYIYMIYIYDYGKVYGAEHDRHLHYPRPIYNIPNLCISRGKVLLSCTLPAGTEGEPTARLLTQIFM